MISKHARSGSEKQIRKRRVKVVRKHTNVHTAALSLLVVFLAAAISFGVWRSLRGSEPASAVQRGLEDIEFTWKCPDNHRFGAYGMVGSRPCPVCGEPAYVVDMYLCEDHGLFEVWLRFGEDWAPMNNVFELKCGDGEWVHSSEGLACPKCGKSLRKAPRDALGRVIEPPRNKGVKGEQRGDSRRSP